MSDTPAVVGRATCSPQILVSPSRQSKNVEIVKLFVAMPSEQSKYVLLSAKTGRNITWHGNANECAARNRCAIRCIAGDGPPNDRIMRIHRDQRISVLTYSIVAVVSGLGILIAVGFFVFNIIFRTHR